MNQRLSVKKYVEWEIEIPFNNASPLKSPDFRVLGSEWYFEIRFEMHDGNKNCTRENLYRIYIFQRSVFSLLKISLKKSFDIITFIKTGAYQLSHRAFATVNCSGISIASYISSNIHPYLQTAVPSGKLCRLELLFILNLPASDIKDETESKFSWKMDKCLQAHFEVPCDLESLSLDLCNLLKSEASSSDILVRCGDNSHHAHKAVLEARSEVFAAMFRNKMVESETGVVEITDMEGADFELFLKFVYSGKIQFPSEDSATCLYAASDKYAIFSLKKACSDYMVRNLNLKNCLHFLEMSERHEDKAFMEDVLNFVAENLDGLDREEWSSFSAEFPKLTVKVYEQCLEGTLSQQVSFKKMKCME